MTTRKAVRPAAALPLRAEVRRQLGRRRTRLTFGFLLLLPLILVGAFALGDGGGSGRGASFVDLAQVGPANFTVFALFASTGFLLVVVVALFGGDAVPAEASWASLRYLLTAPVPRGRLLRVKLQVALLSSAAALVLLPVWCLVVGTVAYGTASFEGAGGDRPGLLCESGGKPFGGDLESAAGHGAVLQVGCRRQRCLDSLGRYSVRQPREHPERYR